MDEEIVLLDDKLRPIGTAPKLASHHSHTPLHLAFSCYIFSPGGKLLLTKRALGKKVWPGVWTNSVCGHPLPDESFEHAIRRRARFELGLTKLSGLKAVMPKYRYKTPPYKGIIENEFCPVYLAATEQEPVLNQDEVSGYRWVGWEELENEITDEPDVFSYWLKDQMPPLKGHIDIIR